MNDVLTHMVLVQGHYHVVSIQNSCMILVRNCFSLGAGIGFSDWGEGGGDVIGGAYNIKPISFDLPVFLQGITKSDYWLRILQIFQQHKFRYLWIETYGNLDYHMQLAG